MNRKYCEIHKCEYMQQHAGKVYCKALSKSIGKTNLSKADTTQCALARTDLAIIDNEIIQQLTKEKYRGPIKKYLYNLLDKFNKFRLSIRRKKEYKKEMARRRKTDKIIANMSDEERAAIRAEQEVLVAKTIKETTGRKSD